MCGDICSVTLSLSTVRQYDCVVVATGHDLFDWELILEHVQLIVDARRVPDRE